MLSVLGTMVVTTIAIMITDSAAIGLMVMLLTFTACFAILALIYPYCLKGHKKYWDEKEAKKLAELEQEKKECQESVQEEIMQMPKA
jgi:predicted membrane protein